MSEARVKLKLEVHPAFQRHPKTDDTYVAGGDIELVARVLDGTLTRLGYQSGKARLAMLAETINHLGDDDRRFVATCIISGQGLSFHLQPEEGGERIVPALEQKFSVLAVAPEDKQVTAELWVPGK